MHLHSLTLQAIGPFAGRHVVDFGALAASGIFLLEGPTGAGKSTLIDAVVFALYGKVASATSSEDRLRSAHASEDLDSFVDLTFETSSGAYRVLRSPEYLRPKKRGSGTTKQQASVKVWRLPGGFLGPGVDLGDPGTVGDLVANRLDEAGLQLQRIVGLDRAQFVQTIVLPQGEFAGFLRAKPEDRRGLLQKVFGTEIYEKAQAELSAMRAEAQAEVTAARTRVENAVESFLSAARLTDEDAVALRETRIEDRAKLAAEHAAGIAAEAEVSARLARDSDTALQRARSDHDEARALHDAVELRSRLRAEAADLETRAPVVQGQSQKLDAARRAAVVRPLLDGEETAARSARQAAEALETSLSAAGLPTTALAQTPEGEEEAATLRAERDGAFGRRASLERLVGLEQGLDARRTTLEAARATLAQRRSELAALTDELEARPALRSAHEHEHDALRATADLLPRRVDVVTRARAALDGLEALALCTQEVEDARSGRAAAAAAARAAVDRERELRDARITDIAGEIADRLTPGEPCPVCGGCEHPAPAARTDDHVTPEMLEAAENARSGAETVLDAASQRLAALEERLLAHQRATEGTDPQSATAALDAALVHVTESEQAARDLAVAVAELRAFDARTDSLRTEHQDLCEVVTLAEARLAHDDETLAADTAEVRAALAADSWAENAGVGTRTLSDVVARLTALVRTIDDVLAARARAESAAAGHEQRRAERETVMREQGFDSADDVRAAVLDARTTAAYETAIREFHALRERVDSGLREDRITALPEDVEVDLDGARDRAQAAEVAARDRAREATRAEDRAADSEQCATAIADAAAVLDVTAGRADPVLRMAALANATTTDNSNRLTLQTYVLMQRFEDVVAAANQRIAIMSDGRYELERSDEKESGGGRKIGLALRVVDHHTGSARLTQSLSGGETFYVSLCLALGMADVVTAEAGGVDLGTLFIDEGFGSLDPETLDSVLRVLGTLRDGGRVVGVVSHVEALKQSISDGISVRRLRDGSSTLTVRAA